MDIKSLDDLENKIQSLITLLENVRTENTRLKQEIIDSSSKFSVMESENNQLKQELDALKNSNFDQKGKLDTVTERILGILSRLESVNWSIFPMKWLVGGSMNSTLESVRVVIFGSEYSIKSDADTSTTKAIAHYVNSKMADIHKNAAFRDHMKVAVLSALNIAGELFETKERCSQQEQTISELQRRIDTLTQKVSSVLA